MSEQSESRRAELKSRLEKLHELYMDPIASPIGSPAERRYERLIEKTEAELDEIFREEQSDWGKDDDYLLSQWGKGLW